jgi:pimeloyl-ACP methyl ester carboxylesterase
VEQAHFIFLPGFMCDGRLFSAQQGALETAGHSCSSGDLASGETIEELAANVLAIAPERFVPIGLSMGGIIALEIVRQAPERVSHLALLNTTYRADKAGPQRIAQIDRVRQGELDLVLSEELKPTYMHPDNRTAERLALLADMGATLGDAVFERQSRALMARRSYAETLSEISCPTLVLAGAQDKVCAVGLHRDIAAAIPGACLKIVQRCGHLSTLEQPAAVTRALLDLAGDVPTKNADTAQSRID